jgi:hypothetical protein
MTNANGAGIVLEYRFYDSFSFHIHLAELFGTENAQTDRTAENLSR